MLSITLTQLKADITPKLKGTSLREITDFYGIVQSAANRMLARIDPQETIRIQTLSTPFFDDVNDYAAPSDLKRAVDIRPQLNLRQSEPGLSHYSETSPRQFSERLDYNSFTIGWNSMIRTLRAQRLPAGNVALLDSLDSLTGNGSWAVGGDASGLYAETLNFVEGSASLGFNISGSTGTSSIVNSTAAVVDLSALLYKDSSFLRIFIPSGTSAYVTSFKLIRGSSASNYKQATATTRIDGTAFVDGWNLVKFDWSTATTTGTPDDTKNTYRKLTITSTAGQAITGMLVDYWTDSLGSLYEMEYYSEYMFRTAAGIWIAKPTADTDLVNVGPASYEILKTEMMVDITQIVRTGATRQAELADWRMMLNGQPPNKYIKDPQYRGLYADYQNKFPSSAIPTTTKTYNFDV